MLALLVLSLSVSAAAPEFSITLSEQLLGGLLAAAAPIELTFEQEVPVAGRVRLDVTLTEPQVRITNAAIKVTMSYHARDASGVVDTRGLAKPDLVIVPNRQKGVFEARVKPSVEAMLEDQLFLGRGWRYFTGVIDVDLGPKSATRPAATRPTTKANR